MGLFSLLGKSKGLEIRPVIRGFQWPCQLGREPEAAVIIRIAENDDQVLRSDFCPIEHALCGNTDDADRCCLGVIHSWRSIDERLVWNSRSLAKEPVASCADAKSVDNYSPTVDETGVWYVEYG